MDDVMYEILLRLPVKTLKRFQCVCKSWFSLISSPQFHQDHFRRAQHNPLLLTLQSEESIFVDQELDDKLILRFSAYNTKDGFTLVHNFSKSIHHPYFDGSIGGKPFMQSCLGLVCIAFLGWDNLPILICNPSTEELISLPPPNKTVNCFGFGYAASTYEFKVVRFFSMPNKDHCKVFTLGTSSWRESKSPPYRVYRGTAPFLHEALHFLPRIFYTGVKDTDYIAVFDIDTEEYRDAIPLPTYYHSLGDCGGRGIANKGRFIWLTTLGGCLCLTFDFGELRECLELWLLKDYNSAGWIKGYTINVSTVYPYPSYSFWAYPADSMYDESIFLSCSDEKGVKVVSYDPRDEIVRLKKDKEWAATFYVESFYRLGGRCPEASISLIVYTVTWSLFWLTDLR